MKILVAHNRYLYRGGEDTVVDAEVRLLREHGHQVRLYTRDNQELSRLSRTAAVADMFWSRQTIDDLRQLQASFAPDLIHAHNLFPLISPSLYGIARQLGIPVVQTLHNFRLVCAQAMLLREGRHCEQCVGHLPWRAVVHGCYRQSRLQTAATAAMVGFHRLRGTWSEQVTRYIVLNQAGRDIFVRGGLPLEKMRIKPHFVVAGRAPSWAQRSGGVFVGRLSTEKGIGVLAQALACLNDIQIDVYGKGPLQPMVMQTTGLRYGGFLEGDALAERMRRAAYLVMPSTGVESFGLVAIEAFACGTPVIASRDGGLRELVVQGQNGLLVPPGDAGALAAAIAYAEAHPEAMRRMGEQAYQSYLTAYTPERNYAQLLQIYQEALAATPLPLCASRPPENTHAKHCARRQ